MYIIYTLLMLLLEQFQFGGMVARYYSFVWKTMFWSGESQGKSENFMLKIPNEP